MKKKVRKDIIVHVLGAAAVSALTLIGSYAIPSIV